ncbi:MAG: redox-sensing transcriptional repressor Rex [Deltaproteobacteria bacterium]|nr:redox-sensing transcriptional repressor Rex [Deltaproteobacteria bacterium]
MNASDKVIGRLSHYRLLLSKLESQGKTFVFSRELAIMADGTSAQVRRDLMVTGYEGNPKQGYNVSDLLDELNKFFNFSRGVNAVLIGTGSLGRALLSYFMPKKSRYNIMAAFDSELSKTGRIIAGTRCCHINELEFELKSLGSVVAILTLPAEAAQTMATRLTNCGIKGILNFAPVRLRVPDDVYVENIDVTMSLEKVAFFANQKSEDREKEV